MIPDKTNFDRSIASEDSSSLGVSCFVVFASVVSVLSACKLSRFDAPSLLVIRLNSTPFKTISPISNCPENNGMTLIEIVASSTLSNVFSSKSGLFNKVTLPL